MISEINGYEHLRDLDANLERITKEHKDLKTEYLPLNKAQEVIDALKTQNENKNI